LLATTWQNYLVTSCYLRLYTNNFGPSPGDLVSNYVEATFAGYAP
jgi:hypothetical protein